MKRVLSMVMALLMTLGMFSTLAVSTSAAGSSISTATPVLFDETYWGSITEQNTKDVYRLTLSESGRINIKVKAYIERTIYYLYDANGEEIWRTRAELWNEVSEVLNADWEFTLTKGTYYFVVEKYEKRTGNYNFQITFESAKESFSESQGGNDQNINQANKISLNKTYNGQIALNDDIDFYKFVLSESGRINIKVKAYIERTIYYLYDADGEEIWSTRAELWNETSEVLNADWKFDLSKGTYYFAVRRYEKRTGNYNFSINCAHNWSSTVNKKATTSADGSGTRVCRICGQKSTYTISKIKSVQLSKTTYTYNGKTQKPSVTVKDSAGKTLKEGTDYTVKYSKGCKYVGQYTVTVTFKGNYSGTKKLTFKIIPKSTSISKLTAGKKQFTVKWNKQTKQTTGYEIQYSTSKKMKSAKTVTVSKNSTTSKTIKNLKASKTYYVRIRIYKTVDGTKFYSSWSSTKSVKTK